MQLTIKKLLGLTLLIALFLNGMINFFAVLSLRREFQNSRWRPEAEVGLEERILILKQAKEASQLRASKLDELYNMPSKSEEGSR